MLQKGERESRVKMIMNCIHIMVQLVKWDLLMIIYLMVDLFC